MQPKHVCLLSVLLCLEVLTCFVLFYIGVGEQGVGTSIKLPNYSKYDELYKVNGFNALLSDKISINRSVPDIRHKL